MPGLAAVLKICCLGNSPVVVHLAEPSLLAFRLLAFFRHSHHDW